MREEYYAIGQTAGKVYQILEKDGQKTLSTLQKEAGVSDAALFNQALGWLAREEKIQMYKEGRGTKVSL